jgi:DNA repair exonuclease SbcCD ATPase subunit
MSNLTISELLIASDLERAAKRIPFRTPTTLIVGGNSSGKSSVLKSIYNTFGAEPAKQHPNWKAANVTTVVKFSVDDTRYAILRKGNFFAVFDANQTPMRTFQRVTHGLGPFLAEMFGFQLKLHSSSKELITPPPAYFFLPYYIDQDAGWANNWSSFAKLQQIPDWRKSVIEYHTGLKPNEFYLAKAALQSTEDDLAAAEGEAHVLSDVRQRVQHESRPAEFNMNLGDFQAELDELLQECQTLLSAEAGLKEQLRDLNNSKVLLETRINLVQCALTEVSADYAFATEHLTEETVDCPTCGAVYENAFIARFEIAKDEDRLIDMLLQLRQEVSEVDRAILKARGVFNEKHTETQRVEELLTTKRQEVSLKMVLQSEGRKAIDTVFLTKLDESAKQQGTLRESARSYREELKKYDNKERKREVLDYYHSVMRSYLHTLNVDRLPEKSYRTIDARISELGSEQPRALLAYFVSILQTIRKFSSSTTCPIIIDSPNQQGQDDIRLPLMLSFIRDYLPTNSQVILGVEDTSGVQFEGEIVSLTERYKLLQDAEYEEVRAELRPMLAKVLTPAT